MSRVAAVTAMLFCAVVCCLPACSRNGSGDRVAIACRDWHAAEVATMSARSWFAPPHLSSLQQGAWLIDHKVSNRAFTPSAIGKVRAAARKWRIYASEAGGDPTSRYATLAARELEASAAAQAQRRGSFALSRVNQALSDAVAIRTHVLREHTAPSIPC